MDFGFFVFAFLPKPCISRPQYSTFRDVIDPIRRIIIGRQRYHFSADPIPIHSPPVSSLPYQRSASWMTARLTGCRVAGLRLGGSLERGADQPKNLFIDMVPGSASVIRFHSNGVV